MIGIKEQFFATDEPLKTDYQFSDFEEFELSGNIGTRPKDKVKIWNQKGSPACTVYSATHIYNGSNVIEDEKLGENRPQVDPATLWNEFCTERNNFSMGSSIQTVAQWFKKKGKIEGYVTINGDISQMITAMKKALDMGYFLSTGSSNGDRAKTKETGIYTIRADKKFVGHGWCIVGYEDSFFWAINSYGDKRGKYNGYFKVPFDIVDKIYSKICYIDKDDSGIFGQFKEREKAKTLVKSCQDMYASTKKAQVRDSLHALADCLREVYNIRDI